MNRVVIGLGSNIRPWENLEAAKEHLASHFQVLGESSYLQTRAVGLPNQPDFLNGVIVIESPLEYMPLVRWLKELEWRLGRVRGPSKDGPRTIDLDVLLFNGVVVDEDVYTRHFLQDSLREIWPLLEQESCAKSQ